MKPITKTIIFVVIAFIIVIGITLVANNAQAPASTVNTPAASVSPTASVSPAASASPAAAASYTLAQVATHKTATDCWTAVGGNVFNLSAFVNKHPGGVQAISQICGVDGTATFTKMHGSNANAQAALATLKIGVLAQ